MSAAQADGPVEVSFIMPAYNAGTWIGAAISSVLAQTRPGVELVVVDDGSTDDTYAIAKGFGDRIVLLQQQNAGPSAARNLALAHARGRVIGLCDSDDILFPNYTALALDVLDAAPPRSIVTCASVALTDHGLEQFQCFPLGRVRPEKQREAIIQANFVSIFSLFPRELVDEIGGFDASLRRCEDWQFWARAVLSGWQVAFQARESACYRRQGVGLSANLDAMRTAEDEFFVQLAKDFAGQLRPAERRLLELRIANGSPGRVRETAAETWRSGDFRRGAALLRQAADGQPLDARLRVRAAVASVAAPALAAFAGFRRADKGDRR